MMGLITDRTAKIPDADTKQPAAGKRHWATYIRGTPKKRGEMNKTETEFFTTYIEPRLATGEYLESWYESWFWRLTERTPDGKPGLRYGADFVVMLADGSLKAFEVKGTGPTNDASMNLLKLAASKIPMPFFLAKKQTKKDGGGFTIEEY